MSFTIPLAGSLVLFKLDKRRADIVMIILFLLAMVLEIILLFMYSTYHGNKLIHILLLESKELGEVYGLIIDPMSVLIGSVVSVAGFIFMFYGIEYMSKRNLGHPVERGKGLFYGWMTLFEGATLGFIYSSTFLGLLVFFELMGLACWGVVSYYDTSEARRAGFKAFIIPNIGAMIGFYTAIGIGITQLHNLSLFSLYSLSPSIKPWLFIALLGAGYAKSAQFPSYSWIPDAMEAPTPASAFLHGAAMVEMGVYLIARIIQFIGPLPMWIFYFMAIMVSITLFIPILNYPVQKDAKRLLAYSTIAEAGVMFTGLTYSTLGSNIGIQASMFQLTTHAFIKGLGFLAAGTFTYSLGTLDLRKIKGLKNILPINSIGWGVALLGLAGLPPMGISFSKATLIMTAFSSIKISLVALVPILMVLTDSVVFLWIGLKWINRNIFSKPTFPKAHTNWIINISIIILIILSIIAPYLAHPFINNINFYWGENP